MPDMPPRFPSVVRLHLLDIQQAMLDFLAERLPTKGQDEIVQGVFSRGLLTLVCEERLREPIDPRTSEEEGFESHGSLRPFPKKKGPDYHSIPPTITLSFDEDLRDRLEEFQLTHPGDLDSTLKLLLEVGLDRVKENPGVLDPGKAIDNIKDGLPAFRSRAQHRCRARLKQLRMLSRRKIG